MEIPDEDDLNCSAWERCNHLIQSWIINSVSPQISQTLVFHEFAIDAWLDLKEHFSIADRIHIDRIHIFWIFLCLNSHPPMHHCTCPHPSSSAAMREACNFRLEGQVIQFLTGLNDQFVVLKAQVLMMDPLPSINKVYSLVIREESKNHSTTSSIEEHVSLVNAYNSRNKPQGKERGVFY